MSRGDDDGEQPMTPRPEERSTFLKTSDILDRTRRYIERARQLLVDRMRETHSEERERLFLETVEEERTQLEEAIDRCTRAAPTKVLETRAQYSVDPWEETPRAPADLSIEEAVQWLLAIDQRLLQTYEELTERTESVEVREFLASLADLVRAHDRRLTKESQAARDI
jgi:rubrerythrin